MLQGAVRAVKSNMVGEDTEHSTTSWFMVSVNIFTYGLKILNRMLLKYAAPRFLVLDFQNNVIKILYSFPAIAGVMIHDIVL